MSRLLQRLFGRLPIGWLQLTQKPGRFAAALTGVAFANVLVLVQLGIMNSMSAAAVKPYGFFDADVMISAQDANTLMEGGNVARQWMLQALADPDVAQGMGLFVGTVPWDRAGNDINLTTFGLDPAQPGFVAGFLRGDLSRLQVQNTVMMDRHARGFPSDEAAGIGPQTPLSFEAGQRTLTALTTFAGGGGFGGDGYMLVSDQTFLSLFPGRSSNAPDHILLRLRPGANLEKTVESLRDTISEHGLRIREYSLAQAEDLEFQKTRRPTGVVFGFGVLIGVLVGLVIIFQVLTTDVAEHLREYATLKAMGYRAPFFVGIVIEEALVLGLLGFVPGVMAGAGILLFMAKVTALPFALTPLMVAAVLCGTIVFAVISGTMATRRLWSSNPVDLF